MVKIGYLMQCYYLVDEYLLIPSFVLVAAIAVGDERYAIFAFILLCGDTTKDDTFCCMELRYNSATALGMILMNLMMN